MPSIMTPPPLHQIGGVTCFANFFLTVAVFGDPICLPSDWSSALLVVAGGRRISCENDSFFLSTLQDCLEGGADCRRG